MQLKLIILIFSFAFCSQVATNEVTSSITILLPQTSTITTLPPAQPSSGSSDPCDFGDRAALLDRVVSDWQGYNVSLLVEKCPVVCILIYGDGNPDVSGVGVSIEYPFKLLRCLDVPG